MVTKKKFCLNLHYNGADSYLFVNGKEILKFKAKDSAIVVAPLCLGNISKDWAVNNMKKTELKGYVYECCVNYGLFNPPRNDPLLNVTRNISSIHNYVMLKYKIK